MSAVLCLPACLCVSPAASRGQAPHGNASKAFQDPCHSETREQKYVQQHIRICTHGVKTGRCDEILEWVGEEVLKEYRNLHHTRGLGPGDRDVNHVGEGPGGEATMDPAGADGDEALVDDDDDDEPAEMAVCAFVAHNGAGSNRGSWKPLQPGWKKK